MNFVKELRDAAMRCSNVDYRARLRWLADDLETAASRFNNALTADRLIALNGAWAAAHRALKNIPPEAPPAPLAGSPEPARLAA